MTQPHGADLAIAKAMTKAAKTQQVLTWILEGASEHSVLSAIAETWPDEKGKPLILAAFNELSDDAAIDRDVVSGWCFQATRFVYEKMIEIGDYTGALRAIKQLKDLSQKT